MGLARSAARAVGRLGGSRDKGREDLLNKRLAEQEQRQAQALSESDRSRTQAETRLQAARTQSIRSRRRRFGLSSGISLFGDNGGGQALGGARAGVSSNAGSFFTGSDSLG